MASIQVPRTREKVSKDESSGSYGKFSSHYSVPNIFFKINPDMGLPLPHSTGSVFLLKDLTLWTSLVFVKIF